MKCLSRYLTSQPAYPFGSQLVRQWLEIEGGLHSPLPVQTPLDEVTDCNKQLPQSNQTVLPFRGTVSADKQECSRTGGKSKLTGVLQPTIFGTQTQQPVETDPRPEHLEHLFKHRDVQDGNPRDNKNLPPSRGVGHIHRFQRRILPYTNSQSESTCPFTSRVGPTSSKPFPFPVHSSHGVHSGGQRGQTRGFSEGYKDPPVPRRLAGESLYPPHLSPAYSNPSHTLSGIRVAGEQGKVRAGSQTGLQLRRLPVRPERGQGQTNRRTLAGLDTQDQINTVRSALPGPTIHVPHRSTHSNRKVHLGRLHMRPIQCHLKKQLEGPRVTGKGDPGPQIPPPPSKVVAGGKQCASRSTITPSKHALQIFTDASKEGWGAHLDEHTARGQWSLPESKLHINHLELKAVFLALKEFQTLVFNKTVLVATDNTTVVSYINKEGGMKSGSLCALLWRILSWCTRQQVTLRARHIPGRLNVIADKLSRLGQTIHTEWSLHPEVFQAVCSRWHQPQVDLGCHQVQQQTTTVCISGTRPPGLGSGCTQPLLGGPGPIRLPTGSHLGQSGGEAPGLPLQQNNSDCSRVAQHALVLGPGSNVKPDPTVSAQHTQPSVSAIQPGPSQEPVESEPTCLAPRASAIKEQGFSEAVAARIEAPQRRATRSVYEAKWTIFTKWCLSNQVNFRAPPLKAIADFLLHLFQEKKLQPSTIDGYRSAIADKLGNSTINVSKDENLTRLLDSFHRDRPKGRRGIPSWNLSLVLHQLTKAPFEPLKRPP